MPYLVCQACGFRAYSAARHAGVEDCPVCGTPLPRRQVQSSRATPSRTAPQKHDDPLRGVRADIIHRLGRVPAFFEPAFANPDVLRELWRQTRLAWLDGPVPYPFRRDLLERLAETVPWPWRVVADEIGQLRSASASEPDPDWPAEGSPQYEDVLTLALQLLLDGPDPQIRRKLQALLDDRLYASLIAVLTNLEACRIFAQAHPGLAEDASARYRRASDPVELAVIEAGANGAITSVSPAAERLFRYSAESLIGKPLTHLFTSAARLPLERLIAEFTQGDKTPLRRQSFNVVGSRQDRAAFDAAVTLANRRRDGQRGGMTAIVEVRRAGGRADHAAAYRVLLGLLEPGARSLPPDAVVDAVAEALGWERVLVWRFDRDPGVLRCVAQHSLAGEPSAKLKARAKATFAPGVGYVGTVFESGVPVWIEDLGATTSDARADVVDPTSGSGVWLPVGRRGETDGVLEFLSSAHRPADSALLEMFGALARQAEALLDPQHEAPDVEPIEDLSQARLAFEGAAVGMALVSLEADGAGVITEANRALAVLTARDRSELIGLSLADLTVPEDVDLDAPLLEELLGGRIPAYQVEKRFYCGPGKTFWGELSVSLIRANDEHRPVYLVAQIADVTERRRIEEALEATRERLEVVFEEAPIGMAITTLDGRWLQVNQALCEILGYSEEELLTKHLSELAAPEEYEMIRRYMRQVLDGEVLGYHIETRARRADGEVLWVQLSVSLVHDYDGRPAYVLIEIQDVGERKRLEEELEQGALVDPVTGLPSRTLLFDRLEQARARLERTRSPFLVVFVAAEGAEEIAERVGRERADAALRELGARLLATVRSGDTVARFSAHEFVLICEDLENDEEAGTLARRVLEVGDFTVSEGEHAVAVAPRLGLTVASSALDSPAALVERADGAMQLARAEHKRSHEYSGPV